MINHISDPFFILLIAMAICIISLVAIQKIFQEGRIPEISNLDAFKDFFKIEEIKENVFKVKVLKKNMIFFRTYEVLHERFSTRQEAEKFLYGRKHISIKNSLYTIRMVYRLRLLNRLSEMKVV